MVLERLNDVKVRSLSLGEPILSVKLKLSGDDRVLSPTMHIKGSLGKDESSGIGKSSSKSTTDGTNRSGIGITEGVTVNEVRSLISTERSDSIWKGVDSISIIERLGTEGLEKSLTSNQRVTVINIGITLDNPNKFLTRVIEVQLDLIGGRSNRLITSELELFKEVLVWVLGHLSSLVSIEEDIIDIKRGSNEGLLVSSRDLLSSSTQITNSP